MTEEEASAFLAERGYTVLPPEKRVQTFEMTAEVETRRLRGWGDRTVDVQKGELATGVAMYLFQEAAFTISELPSDDPLIRRTKMSLTVVMP